MQGQERETAVMRLALKSYLYVLSALKAARLLGAQLSGALQGVIGWYRGGCSGVWSSLRHLDRSQG
jgi:hypothetical protein